MVNVISNSAKKQLSRYANVSDKNRICPTCGFENTKQSDVNGFCMTCQTFYSFYQSKDSDKETRKGRCLIT